MKKLYSHEAQECLEIKAMVHTCKNTCLLATDQGNDCLWAFGPSGGGLYGGECINVCDDFPDFAVRDHGLHEGSDRGTCCLESIGHKDLPPH
jgi:hypothetical protein